MIESLRCSEAGVRVSADKLTDEVFGLFRNVVPAVLVECESSLKS